MIISNCFYREYFFDYNLEVIYEIINRYSFSFYFVSFLKITIFYSQSLLLNILIKIQICNL
jgi:hypothetical protein